MVSDPSQQGTIALQSNPYSTSAITGSTQSPALAQFVAPSHSQQANQIHSVPDEHKVIPGTKMTFRNSQISPTVTPATRISVPLHLSSPKRRSTTNFHEAQAKRRASSSRSLFGVHSPHPSMITSPQSPVRLTDPDREMVCDSDLWEQSMPSVEVGCDATREIISDSPNEESFDRAEQYLDWSDISVPATPPTACVLSTRSVGVTPLKQKFDSQLTLGGDDDIGRKG